jgi:hypothetical protein
MSSTPGAPDFWIKAHDRMPIIQATLATNGVPVNITGATIKFLMAKGSYPGDTLQVNAAATIVDAVNGIVSYSWTSADTSIPGDYLAEWEVTYASGVQQTFPTADQLIVRVVNDLDGV